MGRPLARGLLLAHVAGLVGFDEPVASCPPVHCLDDVAAGDKTGCLSNQHLFGFCTEVHFWSGIRK